MWHQVAHSRSAAGVASRSTSTLRRAVAGSHGSLADATFFTCRRSQSSRPLVSSLNPSTMLVEDSVSHVSMSLHVRSSKQQAVMRTLLNTLQVAADLRLREMTNPWALHVAEGGPNEFTDTFVTPISQQPLAFAAESAAAIENVDLEESDEKEHSSEAEEKENSIDRTNHPAEGIKTKEEEIRTQEPLAEREQQKPLLPKPTLQGRLVRAVNARRLKESTEIFHESVKMDCKLDSKLLLDLFDLLVFKDSVSAYNVLCRYRELEGQPMVPEMYAKLCDAVGYDRPPHVRVHRFRDMVKHLGRELRELDIENFQHICYPRLVVSLVKQRDGVVGRAARPIYEYMLQKNFPLTARMLEECLKYSKYTRPTDLPYHNILSDLVAWGHRPYPTNTIQVLQNLFPFTDTDATSMALKAILELQSSTQPADRYQCYPVDLGTLEQITAAGARKASSELNLMVWDLLEVLGYQPTETIYENTIQAFCMSYRQDDSAFAVLADMEANGFEPSRALIRSISRSLRFSPGRADHAYYMITNGDNELAQVSVASLNAILSACAELGDVDRAFATYDDFDSYCLEPTADSFSFLLEALAVNIHAQKDGDESAIENDAISQVDAAESIVAMMNENGFTVSNHALHEYVRVLCFSGDIDGAIRAVDDAFEKKEQVANKTLFFLVSECLTVGRFGAARDLASKTSEPWKFLERRIDKMEADASSESRHDV